MKLVAGNRITLLKNGAEFFPALIAAIDAAVLDIRIEMYIFSDDVMGERIADALIRAAQRGIAVRLMIDGVGSRETPESFFARMRDAGVRVLVFRPDRRAFHFSKTRLRRNHRKIALVDGRVGFVGGINLIDDLTESLSEHPRYDYAVQVEGPVLADIYPAVQQLWQQVAAKFGVAIRRRESIEPALPIDPAPVGPHQAMFVERDNFRHRRSIEHMYVYAIKHATTRVLIMCPYFLPGRRLRRTLAAAARRGVEITILLQGRADHPLLQMATRALYTQLLGAGIRICEYEKSMLHGKVATIDDRWATVGSSNLDPFSLFMNREANMLVLDDGFAKQLRESIEAEMSNGATVCRAEDWHRRSLWVRVQTWLAYGFARWVAGVMGFAKRWE
jgi:cardiolipin synthase A/B